MIQLILILLLSPPLLPPGLARRYGLPPSGPPVRYAAPSVESYQPLRQVGTNVYDLSYVIALSLTGRASAWEVRRFRVSGSCQARWHDYAVFECSAGFQYVGTAGPPRNPSQTLNSLAAAAIGSGGPISLGQLTTFSPSLMSQFAAVSEYVGVRHCPTNRPNEFFAIPLTNQVIRLPNGRTAGGRMLEFGIPIARKDAPPRRLAFLPDGSVKEIHASEASASNPEAVIAWQLHRANNGSATAQYDLAKRYLVGDGVAPDLDEAHRWATMAASNGHTGALDLLKNLPKP